MPTSAAIQRPVPHLLVLATGGTIAGSAPSSTQSTGYTAGVIGVETLLEAIPQAKEIARITGEQIANIDSKDMSEGLWLRLRRRVAEAAIDDAVDGIVITHGTDTLEETAWFLQLTVNCPKPLILTGAMRPATALSADGPANLWQALLTAAHPQSAGKGVLVVMNGQIDGARDVTKAHANSPAAFLSPHTGPLGFFAGNQLHWAGGYTGWHTGISEFTNELPAALPSVKILYGCAGDDSLLIDAAVRAGVKGIVYAGFGNGSLPAGVEPGLSRAQKAGIPVVICSRCQAGAAVPASDGQDRKSGKGGVEKNAQAPSGAFLCGGSLSPQKARILLQLALTQTADFSELERIFRDY